MSRKAKKPVWEPGYNGHVYWLGKAKLGKVTRQKSGAHKYSWEAFGRGGTADDLAKARRAVEEAAAMAGRQMDLFGQ
ncbi:MAG: hypothetical protein IT513_16795 [Burkholderiales bacterium]|nr:hypothetical protein [Burkholderiales bacterium]